jgi:hypothetical protein
VHRQIPEGQHCACRDWPGVAAAGDKGTSASPAAEDKGTGGAAAAGERSST